MFTNLRTIQNILMTCWLLGEQLLAFGLLFFAKGQECIVHIPCQVCHCYYSICFNSRHSNNMLKHPSCLLHVTAKGDGCVIPVNVKILIGFN